ncbi:MAG: FtsW/RodA/SpoVE family cell cycle protein [Candidatus Spechtbacterales bacterium]
MRFLSSLLGKFDWILLAATLGLVGIGILSLFSTTAPGLSSFYRQALWAVVGLGAFVLIASVDYRVFRVHSLPVLALYGIGVLGLVVVLVIGSPVRGAQSWINVGFFNIEPVEPLKVILVLIFAKYFSMRHVEMYRLQPLLISAVYLAIPAFLILRQPDVGSLSILVAIWFGMVLVSGITPQRVAAMGAVGVGLVALGWNFLLQEYQKGRILSFLDPSADPLGAGYNSLQSLIAIASGGIWGQGLRQGTQSQLGFLPEAQTDFIYSAIAEEFGIFMVLLVLVLFAVLFWRLFAIARMAHNNFARLTVVGVAVMVAAQLFLNIGVAMRLAPVAGVTLPFVSYGGSSLLTLFLAMGIVQSIYRNTSRAYEIEERDILAAEMRS